MNIQEAKNEIKNTIEVYLEKNEFGDYLIPSEKQRPIFLLGSAGIGKTAIIEQIGSELDLPIISYNMTHHTRQSSIGLPYIEVKEFDGKLQKTSEYTMSEIVGNIYNMIEKTGKEEGILFLDEINCVSETLAPIMLQFLQYKIFGNHPIPKGYIIVTAGNPPQYNKSAKEYDIATLDRLKLIKVTDNFEVWREYATLSGVHESILSFLTNKPHHLNIVSKKIDGKEFVTPRSWEDFSRLLKIYEIKEFNITKEIIGQYIQSEVIVNEFYAFYKLFILQKEKVDINLLLDGKKSELDKINSNIDFEEKLIIISIMHSNLKGAVNNLMLELKIYEDLKKLLSIKVTQEQEDGLLNITGEINKIKDKRDQELISNNLVETKKYEYNLLFDRFD